MHMNKKSTPRRLRYKNANIYIHNLPPFKLEAGDYYILFVNEMAVVYEAVDNDVITNVSGENPLPNEADAIALIRERVDKDELAALADSREGRFKPAAVAHKVQQEIIKGSFALKLDGYSIEIDTELLCTIHNELPKDHALRAEIQGHIIHVAKTAESPVAAESFVFDPAGNLRFCNELATAKINKRKANQHARKVFRQLEEVSQELQSAIGNQIQAQKTFATIPEGHQCVVNSKEDVEPIGAFLKNLETLMSQFQGLNEVQGIHELRFALANQEKAVQESNRSSLSSTKEKNDA